MVSAQSTVTTENKKEDDKVVIFIFSDGLKSQFTNAKPILDKYGFKGTFDVICNYVGKKNGYMNWNDIKTLHNDGNDIGSHSMSHVRLTELSNASIEYEVGKSKKCLDDYGIDPKSFEYPFSTGSDNKAVVETVAKYYDFATRGNDPLMFLRCDQMKQYGQKDCKTFTDNGSPTYTNRYSIRNWSHDFEIVENSFSDSKALKRFIDVVNGQLKYNKNGTINAIPIIMYHDIGEKNSVTNVDLFKKEMKYLHDNKFNVITISDLGYNEKDNYLYVKELAPEKELPTKNIATPTKEPTENVTAHVTTPAKEPTENVTANVTTPGIPTGGNPILEALKQLFGLK